MKSIKKQIQSQLDQKDVQWFKSWSVARLNQALTENAHVIGVEILSEDCEPSGNWNTAKDWFPSIEVDQETRTVTVTRYNSYGYQSHASISTEWLEVDRSEDGTQVFIRGEVFCQKG